MFLEKLKLATITELQIWMWSAGITGLALGIYSANYLKNYALIILTGAIAAHLIIMFRIYGREV